ncbi:MAG: IS630 family transposase [Steroidobacteraceae bacterium]
MSHPARALEAMDGVLEVACEHAKATRVEYRIVIRARILCAAFSGVANEENARHNGVHADTVRKARLRAESATSAAEAFADAPRSGRPRRILLETRATLVQIACTRPTPELEEGRVDSRMREARAARQAAKRAEKCARAKARRAEARERAATRRKLPDGARRARMARNAAVREQRRAHKALLTAQADVGVAQADASRAAKGAPAAFSAVWTHERLQAELERQTGQTMSVSEIGRTLCCGGLRPHRVRMWLHSPDPDFKVKVKVICDLYLNPPAGAVVLSIDEKTGMQARADLYPIHARGQGRLRKEFEYVRNGTSTLIAAFNIQTGEVFGGCWRRTAAGIDRFLEALAKRHPDGDVYLVWDNLNVHKGAAIDAFNARHGGRFHFVYTPLHASWMNQVEIWFSILQRRVLRHGSFSSPADLNAAVLGFVRHWNDIERRPFRWRFRGEFAPRLPWAA